MSYAFFSNIAKKLLALFLGITLICGLCPITAFANTYSNPIFTPEPISDTTENTTDKTSPLKKTTKNEAEAAEEHLFEKSNQTDANQKDQQIGTDASIEDKLTSDGSSNSEITISNSLEKPKNATSKEKEVSLSLQNTTTATVNFTAQAYGLFLFAPQFNVAVSSNIAENYGYTDSVTNGVSALDVLVKAHEIALGDYFTPETASDCLVVAESGFIQKLFSEETSANGFVLNGGYPGGKNGTTVSTQAVVDGDTLDYFIFQDQSYWSDCISWFCKNGTYISEEYVQSGSEISLSINGCMHIAGYAYDTPEQMRLAGEPMTDAHIAWVDMKNGSLTEITDVIADENGAIEFSAPSAEGTYYLTAYITQEDIEYGDSPLIMSLLKVVVDNSTSIAGPCDLMSLQIASFESNPDALTMTPSFDGSITEYTVPIVKNNSFYIFRSCFVKATAAYPGVTIYAKLNNGPMKELASGDTNWVSFNSNDNVLEPGNNTLTITVSLPDSEVSSNRIYTVHIPMEDPDAPAKVVKTMIDALGEISLASGPAINEARVAYDALSDTHKALIDNYDILLSAEKLYTSLETAAKQTTESLNETISYLAEKVTNPTVSSIGGEWAVLGFALTDSQADKKLYQTYLNNLGALLQEKNGQLSTTHYTDYARVVLALASIGYDATDVAGYNLLIPLTDYTAVCRQGINGPIWTLIALDSRDYEIPQASEGIMIPTTRELLISTILEAQLDDGGWALGGNLAGVNTKGKLQNGLTAQGVTANSDTTAMALIALAPYIASNPEVAAAVDLGIQRLASFAGRSNNAWSSLGPERCSQIIIALSTLGIDPANDIRFASDIDSPLIGLLSYKAQKGGFSRTINGAVADNLSSEQGLLALAAYNRFLQKMPPLFSMKDIASDANLKIDISKPNGGKDNNSSEENGISSKPNNKGNTTSNNTNNSNTGNKKINNNSATILKAGSKSLPMPAPNDNFQTKEPDTNISSSASESNLLAGESEKIDNEATPLKAAESLPLWPWIVLICVGTAALIMLLYIRKGIKKQN